MENSTLHVNNSWTIDTSFEVLKAVDESNNLQKNSVRHSIFLKSAKCTRHLRYGNYAWET